MPHGHIVELPGGVGVEDGQAVDADVEGDVLREGGGGMAVHPCALHVDQREVGDIERIGDVAEKLADGDGVLARHRAAGAHAHHQREQRG